MQCILTLGLPPSPMHNALTSELLPVPAATANGHQEPHTGHNSSLRVMAPRVARTIWTQDQIQPRSRLDDCVMIRLHHARGVVNYCACSNEALHCAHVTEPCGARSHVSYAAKLLLYIWLRHAP
jgi:hypothetical protein